MTGSGDLIVELETLELETLEPAAWPAYLSERSGLPGPRANTALVIAAARQAGPAAIDELLADGGEYPAMCAAAALGRRAEDATCEERARALATDERWRVREGVAIGLQLLGDIAPDALAAIVRTWVEAPDPLVQRAAVAAVCEPRLLRTAESAAVAIDACRTATDRLASLTVADRRSPGVRALRQTLGYCWSVAVAADPAAGLAVFLAQDTTDPDIAWIVSQNLRKKRLASLLPTPGE